MGTLGQTSHERVVQTSTNRVASCLEIVDSQADVFKVAMS